MGPAAEYVVQMIVNSAPMVKRAIQGFSEIGMDELIFWPTVPELDQVDRLAEIVG